MKTPEQTKNYYNGIAKGYPELYHEEQQDKIKLIQTYLPNQGSLLDLGAGAGVLNTFLQPSLSLVTSFDLSQALLDLNSNKEENKIQGDICNLPFEGQCYDTICSFTVIQDIYDIVKAFEEIYRVLKKDGKVIISFLRISKNKELIETLIKKHFKIEEKIEEFKDEIYVLRKIN